MMSAIFRSMIEKTKLYKYITHSDVVIGFLFATGAAIGFSAKAIFVKLAYNYDVDAVTLLMFRMLFALPFFIVIAWIQESRASARIRMNDFVMIVALGLLGYYASSLLDFLGLQYISAGLERLILFIYPTIVVMISAIFLGKAIQKEAMIALFLCYLGIAVAMFYDVQLSREHVFLGAILVFASTLTYSIFLVGSGEVIPKVGAQRFTAYAMIVSCLAVFVHFACVGDRSDIDQPLAVYGYGFAMAVFSTVIPALMLGAAIARVGASQTAIIGGFGPIATIVMASIFLDEAISMLQLLGAALVITGIFILGRRK